MRATREELIATCSDCIIRCDPFGASQAIRMIAMLDMEKNGPHYRYGQAVFNAAVVAAPVQANRLCGTARDPFYVNSRVEDFLEALFEASVA